MIKCQMCNMEVAGGQLYECSVCVDEGCLLCIPGVDTSPSPCRDCDALAEVSQKPELPPADALLTDDPVPDDVEARLVAQAESEFEETVS